MANTRHKRVNSNIIEVSPKVEKRREEGKEKFLERLKEMPIIQSAAAFCGINRSTYYRWRDSDSDFKERAEQSLNSGNEFMNDVMESLLIKKAKEGNMTAVIFWLKNHSQTYIDTKRFDHFHEFKENPLTEEKKIEIAKSIAAWDNTCRKCGESTEEDELDSDYLLVPEEEVESKPQTDILEAEEIENKKVAITPKTAKFYQIKKK